MAKAKSRELAGELISEAVALVIIIAFGDSAAAMYTLYDPSPYKHAYWGVCMAWGLAVAIAIYTTGSVSGCHANPAVTLALALYRKFPWKKVLPYCAAQTVGALAGAGIVSLLFSLVRTREPYVDTESVGANPIQPGQTRAFRLILDSVPQSWNQNYPKIRVIQVAAQPASK